NKTLGYRLQSKSYTDLAHKHNVTSTARIAVVAYTDDTTWIAESKEQLSEITLIAKQFYSLNQIKVNRNKSKLLVINSCSSDQGITLSGQRVVPEKRRSLIRVLGVWISKGMQESLIRQKASNIVKQVVGTLYKKKITVSQLIYINNM
ncbi:12602_t:CDS:1, partial [Gigaspora margarita]